MAYPYDGLYENEYDEEPERIFDPRLSPTHRGIPADLLIVHNTGKKVQHLRVMNPRTGQMGVDRHSVVVSIDGACRGNGTPSARASWGVYFGPQSPHNSCGMLDSSHPQTSTRAEIEALSQALDIIDNMPEWLSLQHYYIRTDSAYVVKTFSEWIQSWTENGGKNSRRKRPAHFGIIKKIHEHLDDMTYGGYGGLLFRFWQVPREENTEADALANEALDKEVGASKNAELAKPRILSISLDHYSFVDRKFGSLFTKIQASSVFQRVEDGQSAKRVLLEDPPPHAVLITDGALTRREYASVWDAVLKYIQQGGTAVIMGFVAGSVNQLSIKPFFAKAGLDWELGSYYRSMLVLNSQVVGANLVSKLLPVYCPKAVYLRNVKYSEAWYVTYGYSVTESLVSQGGDVLMAGESPVLLACVGQGKLGFVGDVQGEEGSEAAVLAMCGL